MEFSLIAVSALVCLVLLALDARRRERATWRDWEILLTPKGERRYDELARGVRDNAQLVDFALGRAGELQRLGERAEARRLLEVGSALLGRFSGVMTHLLAEMARFSRMTWAMAGVPPLPAARLRTPPLAWRAHLTNLVQPFCVTAGERFRLRLLTLRGGYRLLCDLVDKACQRVRRGNSGSARDWDTVSAARDDVATLTDESLSSLRVLLTALGARPRAEAPVLAQEPRG
jgi:hypothetical protein